MLIALIPGILIQSVNDQMKAFLVSIGYAKPFGILNFIVIGFWVLFGWLTIMVFEMPIYGFPICKAMSEICVFVLCIILMCRKVPKEQKPPINWKSYKEEIGKFLCGSLKVMAGFYSIFLGFE